MSIKGIMFHFLLRNRHFLKGKLRREEISRNTSIERLRKECDDGAERLAVTPAGISIRAAEDSPVYAEWISPQGADESKVILYFHGGGFVMGNARSHRGIVGKFVNTIGIKALLFDYSLAPEAPAPAAVNDSEAVYQWLLEKGYRPENIIFAGDSAGGGIEIAALIKLRDDCLPLPAACVAFSPSLDMTMSGNSHKTRKKSDPCTPKGMTETYYSYYVGEGDSKHPYASPLFGDLTGLPPIMIHVGNDEVLRDDSVLFGVSGNTYGIKVKVVVWKGMFHCFPLLAPLFREATEAMNQVNDFIHQNLFQEIPLSS